MTMARDAGRPLRADAQRNRDKILAAAVRVFTEEGRDAHFERIAREAGVGTGTLYRNFPTREALIEAAYMFAALSGIALTSARPEQREQAERLLDLTLDGLRPPPPQAPDI
jgi:AcrR family transcriptional regulator